MKRYQDYLLLTDIDGTLNNDAHEISVPNKEAIAFFTENGGSFALATGRSPVTAAAFIKQLRGVNAPCIFYNGAMLYNWQCAEPLCVRHVQFPELRAYLEFVQLRYPEITVQIHTEQEAFILSGLGAGCGHIRQENGDFTYAALPELLDRPWVKVMLCHSEHALLEECALQIERFDVARKTNHFFSAPWYFEIVARNVSKGAMLEKIRGMPQYRGKKIFAAGDFHNDIEMLRRADCGIAPANAESEVKAAADIVSVDNNHHLMHEIIYHIMGQQQLDKRIGQGEEE